MDELKDLAEEEAGSGSKDSTRDMTRDMTEGSIVRQILLFSIPMLIGNVFQQLYNMVDSIIVGQFVGADALASVGATSSITFFFFALCNGIGSGGGIVTSQSFGGHDDKRVRSCIANTGYIMIMFPIVIGTLAFCLARPLLIFLSTPENILNDAVIYTRTMSVGLLFVSLYNYISSMLRALGDSKTPLYFLIFSCLLNVVLDLLCVRTFNMGVYGAGLATIIAQFASGVLCIIYAFWKNAYFRLKREDLEFKKDMVWQTLRLGIPLSLQFSLIAISCMALQKVVNAYGSVCVAAFTATSRIEQLVHQPYQTLSAALSTFCGQNYGAKKNDRVIKGYKKSMLIMVIFTLIILPVMQIFGDNITSWFVSDAEVIAMGGRSLRITSLFYIFLGMIYVVRGVLNGVGDAFFAMFNGIVEVIGRFTVPLLLTGIAAIGLWGIWWSVGVVWGLSGITSWIRYLYQKKRVLKV